MTSEQIMKVVV